MLLSDYKREIEKMGDEYKIEVPLEFVSEAVSELSSIPVGKLSTDDKKKFLNIDSILKENIIGQDEAIDNICKIIKRNKVGLHSAIRPLGVLLFTGSSGTGKSLVAKQLAEQIFGDKKSLVRIDMSEYSEKSSVSKLTGSSPGYIGYERGGILTEAIKSKPHSVLLLDEIEKADPTVYNVFLQLFDEGRLTDSSGQLIDFKNTIIIMTSNIGVKQANELSRSIGFNEQDPNRHQGLIEKSIKRHFSPEFLNRIDKIIFFNNLSDKDLREIVKLECEKFNTRLRTLGFSAKFDDSIIDKIHELSLKEKEYGARPIIRLLETLVEDTVTNMLLENEYPNGYEFKIEYKNNGTIVK